jgi:hypothetical protein
MSITFQLEVDEDEIVANASNYEKKLLLKLLLSEMKLADIEHVLMASKNEELKTTFSFFTSPRYRQTVMEEEHNKALMTLSRRYITISQEDCNTIINISKKY